MTKLPTDVLPQQESPITTTTGRVDLSTTGRVDDTLILLSVGILCYRITSEENGVVIKFVKDNKTSVNILTSLPDFSATTTTLEETSDFIQAQLPAADAAQPTASSVTTSLNTTYQQEQSPCTTTVILHTAANADNADNADVSPFNDSPPLRCCVSATSQCYIEYDTRRISAQFAASIARTWSHLLSVLPLLPLATLISRISFLDAHDRHTVLHDFNNPVVHNLKKRYQLKWKKNDQNLLHSLFQRTATKFGKRIAVEGPNKTISYSELDEQSNILGHYLVSTCGVLVGDTVGLLFNRGVDSYIAMLGIMKAGAAYVPLDVSFPIERIKFTLQQATAKVLLSSLALQDQCIEAVVPHVAGCAHVALENVLDPASNSSAGSKPIRKKSPAIEMTEHDRCYIIFTSGSTGRPKGVQIHHRAAVNLVLSEASVYQVRSDDRVLQGFSLAFDASVEEVWMVFYSGATLVVGTTEIMKSGPDLPGKLTNLGITCFSTVPTLLNTIPSQELPTVRLIIVGGEACSRELANRWSTTTKVGQLTRTRDFFNTYGPTEATVVATIQRCVVKHREDRVFIGTPIPNYRVYIVAPGTTDLLPPGFVGELMIGGLGVSTLGYVGEPEKTRARFVTDPYVAPSVLSSNLMYHSGDLARYDALTGSVEFCGRMDQQVKIRGYRVELSEIESVMLEVGTYDVESAVVDIRDDKLIGFVLLRKDDNSSVVDADQIQRRLSELREKMATLLASYMVPAVIYAVDEIPKLTSGKVVRSQLKEPVEAATTSAAATSIGEPTASADSPPDTAPELLSESLSQSLPESLPESMPTPESKVISTRIVDSTTYTKEQKMVVDVFEQQLGLGTVKSLDDSFFHLGGHSLLVSRAVTSLREKCPTISARDFYESKGVVIALAAIVVQRIELGSRIDTKRKLKEMARLHDVRRKPRTSLQLCCADIAQTLSLWFLALMGLAHTYGVIALIVFIYAEANFGMMVAWFVGLYYGLVMYSLLLAFLMKWLLIGKYKAGVYALWGSYHVRWWFVRQLLRISAAIMFKQTCFAPLIYRCMGAKVGKRVFLGSSSYVTSEFDLIEVGDDTTINEEAELKCHQIKDRVLILKQIKIGNSVTVSARSIVSGGAVLSDQVFLEPFTLVSEDLTVPAGEHWGGSPAFKLARWSEDAHTPAPTITPAPTFISEVAEVAEVAEELAEGEAAAEKQNEPLQGGESKTNEHRPVDSSVVDSSVVNVGTPRRSHVVPEGAVYAATSITRRSHLFPCWITGWQILITLFGTLLSIAIYLPSLAMITSVIVDTTPNSIQEYDKCRATFYCARGMVCAPLPSVDDQGGLQVSQERFCVEENNLEVLFSNVTAVLEINEAMDTCRPVEATKQCDFPFEHQGGMYTSCTLDPSPNMTIETTAWCKTTDGQWSLCQEPCHAGDIEIESPEVFVEDSYNSFTGLSYSVILGTIVAANFSSLILAWCTVALMIRILRSCENKCIHQENQRRGDKDAENMPYSISSWRFIAKWWMGSLLNTAGAMAQPLQGTMMMPFWLRMMGATVGKNVEFSSTKGVALDTLTIGDGAFVADSVMLGVPSVDRGTMRSRPTSLNNRAFVGNGSFVREGSVLGEDSLIALQTAAPRVVQPESVFLGSPPLSIEKREKKLGKNSLTYHPSCQRRAARLAFEIFGYLLYHTYLALFATTSLWIFDWLYGRFGEKNPGLFLFTMPIVQLLVSGVLCLLIVISKWCIMCGRFQAGHYPLFSFYVWRTELVERLEENLAEPLLLNMLDGTCWKVLFYRCMGAKIGRRPYLDHSVITEPDMITIGDDATIESGGTLQAHLFQDRMRLVKPLALGASVSVGANSVILLGGKLWDNVILNPLSLSMRDEELPPRTEWYGSPATRVW